MPIGIEMSPVSRVIKIRSITADLATVQAACMGCRQIFIPFLNVVITQCCLNHNDIALFEITTYRCMTCHHWIGVGKINVKYQFKIS